MATPLGRAAANAAGSVSSEAAARALRIKRYRELLQQGPEALQQRAAIAAENAAARQARAAAREDRVAPILEAMRGNQAAVSSGGDIPRPRPTADVAPSPVRPRAVEASGPYPVDDSRILELLDRVNTQGMDSLGPEDLIVLEDLQSGRAVRSGASAPAAPLDAPEIAVEAPDLNGNLAASGVELDEAPKRSGQDNLRPKTARQPSKLEKIANEITQIAGSARTGEAIAPRQARATWKKVEGLTSEEFEELVGVIGNEDAALANLEQVQNIAGDVARDPNSLAAAALDRAKQAREGTMRAPNSESPEFATDNLTTAELPGAFEDAMAAQRERQLALESRSVGGGLSLEDRIVLAGLDPSDPNAARQLPFWLKGRDGRPTALESRSRGSRSVEGNDIKILASLTKAREELAAAATPEEQAMALAKVTKEEEALNRKFPGGRKEMADSRLNKGGQQETFDDAVLAIVGARPRADRSLARPNAAMSAAERQAMAGEAVDTFGEDAFEFLPDEIEIDDVADLGESGKPKKVRGRPLPSRSMGAMQLMFGGKNPLAILGSPEAVADEILAKQSIFRPGTANYDMARERLAQQIQGEFGGPGPRPASSDPAALPGPATARGTSQDPARLPALPGGTNVRVESPTGSPVGEFAPITQSSPPAVAGSAALSPSSPSRPKGLPGPKPDLTAETLESSAIDLADEAGDVADDALNAFDRDMPAGARTSGRGQGRGKGGKGKGGKGGAKKDPVVVDADKVELVDPDKPFTANADELRTRVEQSTSSGTQVRDAMKNPPDLRKPQADPNAKPKGGGDGGKPPEDPPKRLEDADGDAGKPNNKKKPTKADDTKPKDAPGKWLKRGLIAAAGLGTIAALSGGGGGGVAAGGEVLPPVPPSGGPGAAGGEVSEDALERALDRIRGSRRGPSSPTYQTLQNWTVWR